MLKGGRSAWTFRAGDDQEGLELNRHVLGGRKFYINGKNVAVRFHCQSEMSLTAHSGTTQVAARLRPYSAPNGNTRPLV